jgi:hypothetical protein
MAFGLSCGGQVVVVDDIEGTSIRQLTAATAAAASSVSASGPDQSRVNTADGSSLIRRGRLAAQVVSHHDQVSNDTFEVVAADNHRVGALTFVAGGSRLVAAADSLMTVWQVA